MWMSFIVICIVSVQWVLWGYSISFAPGNWFIGGLQWCGLGAGTVGQAPSDLYATTIPHYSFMIFQCMFAVITPALMTGTFAERFKFNSWLLIVLLWTGAVYAPMAHWVWASDGWLFKLGSLDFAGGTGFFHLGQIPFQPFAGKTEQLALVQLILGVHVNHDRPFFRSRGPELGRCCWTKTCLLSGGSGGFYIARADGRQIESPQRRQVAGTRVQ